jgi:hypothetical protein
LLMAAPPLPALPSLAPRSFADETQVSTGQRGVDRVRNYQIGRLNVKLNYFEEVGRQE